MLFGAFVATGAIIGIAICLAIFGGFSYLVIDSVWHIEAPKGYIVFDPNGNLTEERWVKNKKSFNVVYAEASHIDDLVVGENEIEYVRVEFNWLDFSSGEVAQLIQEAQKGEEAFFTARQIVINKNYDPDKVRAKVLEIVSRSDQVSGPNSYPYPRYTYDTQIDDYLRSVGLSRIWIHIDYPQIPGVKEKK